MARTDAARQHDSATRYLGLDLGTTGLATTVGLLPDLLGFPAVMVNILDAQTQYTLASTGLPAPADLPRTEALCAEVLATGRPVVIPDLSTHRLGAGIGEETRSYAGVPITGREGLVVGTLCVFDGIPRQATVREVEQLQRFALVVEDQLELLRRRGAPSGSDGLSMVTTSDLTRALRAGQVRPWFQPVVELPTGRLCGVEALARWEHPVRGLLPPASFLPLAEDSELVIDLDLAVLEGALPHLRRWLDLGHDLQLNMNLSPRHFAHPECVSRFAGAAEAAGVPPSSIALELTENSMIAADDRDVEFLAELRELGFGIWLDDFGTGWSTIQHVLRLPADGLKIDRGVTSALGTRKGDAVVRAIVGMAVDSDLDVVIEGVETIEQRDRAGDLGCVLGQGYLWGRPVPPDELVL